MIAAHIYTQLVKHKTYKKMDKTNKKTAVKYVQRQHFVVPRNVLGGTLNLTHLLTFTPQLWSILSLPQGVRKTQKNMATIFSKIISFWCRRQWRHV